MVGVEQQGAGRTEGRVLCLTRHAELSAGTGMCSCSLQCKSGGQQRVSPFQYLPICHPHGLCRSEKGIGCSKNKVQNFLAARVGDAAFEFLTSKFFQKRVSDEYKEDAAAAHGDDKRLTSAAAACSKRRARIAAQVTAAASSACAVTNTN